MRDTTELKLKSNPISHFHVCEWLLPIHSLLNCIALSSFQMTSEPLKMLMTELHNAVTQISLNRKKVY